jgi:hypothetical protein
MEALKKGDKVKLTYGGETVEAEVLIASGNGRSLMLTFDALLKPEGLRAGGFAGMLPVLREDDGQYRDIYLGQDVNIVVAT